MPSGVNYEEKKKTQESKGDLSVMVRPFLQKRRRRSDPPRYPYFVHAL
jgi:hypothetical protein